MSWVSRITKRSEYIEELRHHLARLPETERSDILRDQEEFFREAVLSGRTEADVIGSLGEPKLLAKTLIAESRLTASENAFGRPTGSEGPGATTPLQALRPASFSTQMNATLRAFLAIIALAPFNLIFVLGPFIALMGCLFGGWIFGGAFLLAGLAGIVMVFSELVGLGASTWAHVSAISLGLATTMFSIAFLVMMTFITSWIAQVSVRYLRWNLDLIAERKT